MKKDNTTILRFAIAPTATTFVLEIPKGAELVDIGPDPMRGGATGFWFAANLNAKTEKRAFARLNTGETATHDATELNYIGRALGLGASATQPGQISVRTVHFFEATGAAAEAIFEIADAMAAVE
jgi:hypothetical protein